MDSMMWDIQRPDPKTETDEESDSELIGVLQFVNKATSPVFSQKDQAVAVMFALYTGIAINNSLTYQKMVQAQLHAKVGKRRSRSRSRRDEDADNSMMGSNGIESC